MTKMIMGAIDAALVGVVLLGSASVAVEAEPLAVIELFTSQGCSSCPAADKLLSELKNDPNLITLSLPIDYWDYLGWKDTLAMPGHTARQKAYSRMRGDREVYTPQVVINGVAQALGSSREDIEKAVAQSRETAHPLSVPIELAQAENRVTVKVPSKPGSEAGRGLALPGERLGAGRHRPRREPRPHHHLHQRGAALDQARRLDRQERELQRAGRYHQVERRRCRRRHPAGWQRRQAGQGAGRFDRCLALTGERIAETAGRRAVERGRLLSNRSMTVTKNGPANPAR